MTDLRLSAGCLIPISHIMTNPFSLALGIDVGGTKVESALVDPSGAIVTTHRHPTDAERGPAHVIDDIVACVRDCLDQSADNAAVAGIGVAGQVDPNSGVVRSAPNLDWTDVPLQARVAEALGLPVRVLNDVRAITWGVWRHGAGRGVDDLVAVFIGTGIGGGVISNGRMMHGHHGTAGEVGHTMLVAGGRDCHCPNRGCWEAYAGGWAIAERAQDAVREDPEAGQTLLDLAGDLDAITGRTVNKALAQGDPLAQALTDATSRYLGAGMTSVVNTFNPARIVMGGGVIEGHPAYVDAVTDIVRERALPPARQELEIVPSELGGQAGVVGAAAYARHWADPQK